MALRRQPAAVSLASGFTMRCRIDGIWYVFSAKTFCVNADAKVGARGMLYFVGWSGRVRACLTKYAPA